MFFEKLEQCYSETENKELQFDQIKSVILEVYNKQYKNKYKSIEELDGVLPYNTILNLAKDYYVNNHLLKTETKQTELKNNSFFKNKKYVCVAPHNTLRFDFNGRITVCCNNLTYSLGFYPETTPRAAWCGEKIKQLRNHLSRFDFSHGCQGCAFHILAGNGSNSILRQYENSMPLVGDVYPTRLIFQLHNTCNYECIMCSGEYSSSILKNRDGLRPCRSVYGDTFVEDITEFLAHARMIEFLGGEPFLDPTNHKLWKIIAKSNPDAQVNIITNGSIYNKKIQQILEELPNCTLHVSLDSIDPKTYAYIRRNGNLDNVIKNIITFNNQKKLGSISVCPMIQNVYELPEIVNFCNTLGVGLRLHNTTGLISGSDNTYSGLYENGQACNKNIVEYKEEFIKEFRLNTLPLKERLKIKYFLLQKKYPDKYKTTIYSFINFLTNYKHSS
jgi:MoaA/NifB/PqqE/SkfB family radical SAM enzyme